jgi:hypothetical protein
MAAAEAFFARSSPTSSQYGKSDARLVKAAAEFRRRKKRGLPSRKAARLCSDAVF